MRNFIPVLLLLICAGAARAGSLEDQLLSAVRICHFDLVEKLIAKGADVNAPHGGGRTVLIAAIRRSCSGGGTSATPDIVGFLLEKNANINAQDEAGRTALMEAVVKGDLYFVRLLLERKPDVNLKDNSGQTALLEAVERKNSAVVRLLLDKGADPGIANAKGEAPVDIARRNHSMDIVAMLTAPRPSH